MDFQKFYMGEIYDAYEYLGAHVEEDAVVFRTFAPQAERVAIIGEFNNWQEEEMKTTFAGVHTHISQSQRVGRVLHVQE